MPTSIIFQEQWWDVMVSRTPDLPLTPVWLCRYDRETKKTHKTLLCQVQNGMFGWNVVVAGEVGGAERLVEGFRTRWQAIGYAIQVRVDINMEAKANR